MGRSSFGLQKKAITANEKPGSWDKWRLKYLRWPRIAARIEWRLEWLVYWCRELAFFDVLEFASRVSIIVIVFFWFWEWGERLKDPLIFRQCIHLRDVAVLLNRGSYVEQYD
jgi:hypothetical protein